MKALRADGREQRRPGRVVALQQDPRHFGCRTQHVGEDVRLRRAPRDAVGQEAGREDVRRDRDPAAAERPEFADRVLGAGSAAEANAGRTARQPVCNHSRARSSITAIASGSVDPAEASTIPVVDLSAGVNPAS